MSSTATLAENPVATITADAAAGDIAARSEASPLLSTSPDAAGAPAQQADSPSSASPPPAPDVELQQPRDGKGRFAPKMTPEKLEAAHRAAFEQATGTKLEPSAQDAENTADAEKSSKPPQPEPEPAQDASKQPEPTVEQQTQIAVAKRALARFGYEPEYIDSLSPEKLVKTAAKHAKRQARIDDAFDRLKQYEHGPAIDDDDDDDDDDNVFDLPEGSTRSPTPGIRQQQTAPADDKLAEVLDSLDPEYAQVIQDSLAQAHQRLQQLEGQAFEARCQRIVSNVSAKLGVEIDANELPPKVQTIARRLAASQQFDRHSDADLHALFETAISLGMKDEITKASQLAAFNAPRKSAAPQRSAAVAHLGQPDAAVTRASSAASTLSRDQIEYEAYKFAQSHPGATPQDFQRHIASIQQRGAA